MLGLARAAAGDEVFRQLVLARIIEPVTWSARKFVKTARRYRTVEIQAGETTSSPQPTR